MSTIPSSHWSDSGNATRFARDHRGRLLYCAAHSSRTGERCKKPAIRGGIVCATHGGRAPQVERSARERLLEAADPAAARLIRALDSLDERVAIKAAQLILDRAGCPPTQAVKIEDPDVAKAALARLLGVDVSQLPEE